MTDRLSDMVTLAKGVERRLPKRRPRQARQQPAPKAAVQPVPSVAVAGPLPRIDQLMAATGGHCPKCKRQLWNDGLDRLYCMRGCYSEQYRVMRGE